MQVKPILSLWVQFSQVTFSVVSDSLWPHGLQHARPPYLSPTPRVYSNSCPLSRWCHPTISSSVVPFTSHIQSFPALGSYQMSQLFESGGWIIGISASASFPPKKSQGWSLSEWTGWIYLVKYNSQSRSSLHRFEKWWSTKTFPGSYCPDCMVLSTALGTGWTVS